MAHNSAGPQAYLQLNPALNIDNGRNAHTQSGVVRTWVVRVLARDSEGRGFDCRPFHFRATTLGKLFMHMRHQAVQLGSVQGAVMSCGWEGNRRSGVALAIYYSTRQDSSRENIKPCGL